MEITNTHDRKTALSMLFSRYLNGDIHEGAWRKMMRTLDDESLQPNERIAFARYMNEMIAESQRDGFNIPAPEEVREILSASRAA